MTIASSIRRFGADRRGATALEFGLLLPVIVMLLLGVLNVSQLASALSSMNFAVQEAARCSAVNATLCPTATATVTYAQSRYSGPTIGPLFVSNGTGCGHTVSATANYELNVGIAVYNVPLSVAACYPGS